MRVEKETMAPIALKALTIFSGKRRQAEIQNISFLYPNYSLHVMPIRK